MAIDPEPPSQELAMLDAKLAHCRKRVGRAADKLEIATLEDASARSALAFAEARRRRWLIDNPPAQGDLLT